MKREYLESLGLEKNTIDLIMAEHGKTVQAVKSELEAEAAVSTDLKTQLGQRDADLAALKADKASAEDLQTKITDLETKYADQLAEHESTVTRIRKQSEIKLGVTQAGARNLKAVMALLDDDKIELADDGIKGLTEQLEALKENEAYLFEEAKPLTQTVAGGNPARPPAQTSDGVWKKAVDKFTKT